MSWLAARGLDQVTSLYFMENAGICTVHLQRSKLNQVLRVAFCEESTVVEWAAVWQDDLPASGRPLYLPRRRATAQALTGCCSALDRHGCPAKKHKK